MSYNSFKEDLTPDVINMLDDCLNISYDSELRTDFLHLSRLLYHMFNQRVYDHEDLPEEVKEPLMQLMDALFLEEASQYLGSEFVSYEDAVDEWAGEGCGDLDFENEDDDDDQLDLDWGDEEDPAEET